jgi:hypothetical protein
MDVHYSFSVLAKRMATDLLCLVCKKRKEKTPAEFELVCACGGDHGVCRPCYAASGPGAEASPARVRAYGNGLFNGRKCGVWRRYSSDEDGEVFVAASTWSHTLVHAQFRAEEVRRARRRRLLFFFALFGLGGLTWLYFFIRRRKL